VSPEQDNPTSAINDHHARQIPGWLEPNFPAPRRGAAPGEL